MRNLLPLRDAVYIYGGHSLARDSTDLYLAVFPLSKVTYPELSTGALVFSSGKDYSTAFSVLRNAGRY